MVYRILSVILTIVTIAFTVYYYLSYGKIMIWIIVVYIVGYYLNYFAVRCKKNRQKHQKKCKKYGKN